MEREFDLLGTVKAYYASLAQDSSEDFLLQDTDQFSAHAVKKFNPRLSAIEECLNRKDVGYFHWLLGDIIFWEEEEYRLSDQNHIPPTITENERAKAVELLFEEELIYVARLQTYARSQTDISSAFSASSETGQWVSEKLAELKKIHMDQIGGVSKTSTNHDALRKTNDENRKAGRPPADWEAIKRQLLRLEDLGPLPPIKGNRHRIGRRLWDWCVANRKTDGFSNPASAPKTIIDRPEIKFELDRMEEGQSNKKFTAR